MTGLPARPVHVVPVRMLSIDNDARSLFFVSDRGATLSVIQTAELALEQHRELLRGSAERLVQGVLEEEAHASSDRKAEHAARSFVRRYPVRRADVAPRVFARATDNYVALSARFPVSVRSARLVKDEMTRRVVQRFEAEGVEVASTTQDVTVHPRDK